jgi:hypothetical protein
MIKTRQVPHAHRQAGAIPAPHPPGVSGHVSYRAVPLGTAPGVEDHTVALRDKGRAVEDHTAALRDKGGAVEDRPRQVHQQS